SLLRSGDAGRRGRGERPAEAPSVDEQRERLQGFLAEFAERAFRRPLTEEQRQRYVVAPFAESRSLDSGLRRAILLTLKSPAFLYHEPAAVSDGWARAARLSFALLDSLPDKALLDAARKGQLETEPQVREQAWRLVNHYRSRARLT